jgi:glycosyltransferase involved in cell wall biosynthesis
MPFITEKLVVIHNGIGPIDFYTRDEARERLAPALGQPLWIGTAAELHPNKQIHVLLRSFKDVAATREDVALVVMGEGQERERLARYATRLGIEDRVAFAGHVDEAARYFLALDLFVLPSHTESLGYVLMEAGLAGLPVVATRVGGIPEVIENGTSGALVRPGSSHLLAVALEALLADPVLRARYGSALRARIEESFSVSRMAQKTLALYASLTLRTP